MLTSEHFTQMTAKDRKADTEACALRSSEARTFFTIGLDFLAVQSGTVCVAFARDHRAPLSTGRGMGLCPQSGETR